MEARIGIVVDSTADFPAGLVAQWDFHIVPIHIAIDGQDFLHGVNLNNDDVIDAMEAERDVKTAPPIPSEYADLFEALLKKYDYLLTLHVSSELSHCYTAAQQALQIMFEDESNRIHSVDTRTCTTGQALVAMRAAELIRGGAEFSQLSEELAFFIDNSKLYFTVDNLYWLKRAGKLNFFSSLMGGMLDVKPLVGLNKGALAPLSKHRGVDAALEAMADHVHEDYRLYRGDCDIWIAHAAARDKAEALSAHLEEKIPAALDRIRLAEVGPTITAHAGPGCICVSIVPT
ncbi:MAG: DegV family protein [Desulfobacterales bacterium]|nr:DegV family protein [Desulfobacterales bacterium]MDJ0885055.1 DegV family protein [Desulfobacterales bacterium]